MAVYHISIVRLNILSSVSIGCDNTVGPLQLEVTWYKIQNTGEQKNVTRLHWEM